MRKIGLCVTLDKNAFAYTYTIFYNNSRIEDFDLVSVDGNRAYLPIPNVTTSEISQYNYRLSKVVDFLGTVDEYISRSGLYVIK